MPANSHIEEAQKPDGSPTEKLVVEFTNGSLDQLRDLGKFFKVEKSDEDPYKVLELAIGLLETVKEKTPNSDIKTEK